jgi:hypothetical protein
MNLQIQGVTDLEAAGRELAERGVPVSGIRHKSPIDGWQGGWQPGVDPERRDYASFADFADPYGNTWTLQEIGFRPAGSIGAAEGPSVTALAANRPDV